jgi:hypothetical protein
VVDVGEGAVITMGSGGEFTSVRIMGDVLHAISDGRPVSILELMYLTSLV